MNESYHRLHATLSLVLIDLPADTTSERGPDCSCGCKHFARLAGPAGADWGVCANPKSHRKGLLTFEHQGCLQFEGKSTRRHHRNSQ